jgi:hypothetical protein
VKNTAYFDIAATPLHQQPWILSPAGWRLCAQDSTDKRADPGAGLPRSGSEVEVNQALNYSAGLNDQTKAQAWYWSDGPGSVTPPGHWNLIAQEVSRRKGHTLGQDAKLFFALNTALLDAGIVA